MRFSIQLVSGIIILISFIAFAKAGIIPIFAENIDEARSQMQQAGIFNSLVFLCVPGAIYNARVMDEPGFKIDKLLSLICMTLAILVLIAYSLRNYLLVVLLSILCIRWHRQNAELSVVPVILILLFSSLVLVVFGMIRAGQTYDSNLILVMSRTFSGLFSEFREWPKILAQENIMDPPVVFRSTLSLVPSFFFEAFSLDKEEYIFSSGLFYRDLLGGNWQGENLGLRTSLYGDFYLSFGVLSFIILPILCLSILRMSFRVINGTNSKITFIKHCMLVFILSIGFSSELSSLIQKLFFIMIFDLLISSANSFLKRLKPS